MSPESDENQPTSPSNCPSPSFKGRLNLQDFVYKSQGLATRSTRAAPVVNRKQPTPVSGSVSPASTSRSNSTGVPKRKQISEEDSSPFGKRVRTPSTYAPPSTYAHLSPLTDALHPGMFVLFIGLNPGVETARTGHAYAHPTNLFWRLLHGANITTRLCRAAEYASLPDFGFTNIVARPSRSGAELAKQELDAGVSILEDKIRTWRPQVACIVGKSIWESIWRVRHGRGIRKDEFRYGWQDEDERMGCLRPQDDARDVAEGVVHSPDWKGARVFVATSTSGLAATPPLKEKQRIWRELGAWVEEERATRLARVENDGG